MKINHTQAQQCKNSSHTPLDLQIKHIQLLGQKWKMDLCPYNQIELPLILKFELK